MSNDPIFNMIVNASACFIHKIYLLFKTKWKRSNHRNISSEVVSQNVKWSSHLKNKITYLNMGTNLISVCHKNDLNGHRIKLNSMGEINFSFLPIITEQWLFFTYNFAHGFGPVIFIFH